LALLDQASPPAIERDADHVDRAGAPLAIHVNNPLYKIMGKRSRIVTGMAPKRGPGRPADSAEFTEVIMIRAPTGTRARLAGAIEAPERVADVIRLAIERELARRSRR
jgi:hypothetical protein